MKRRKPTWAAIAARPITSIVSVARAEAEQARHGYLGVEHLLLTLAHPTAPATHQLLAEHDIMLDRARETVRHVVGSGHGDGPQFDSATLLATLAIDLDQIRRQVERQFGPDAIQRLYSSEVGWNLRPRGPLCEPPPTPNLKKAISGAIGSCWDNPAPPRLHERLLLGALDTNSPGLTAVLDELHVPARTLRRQITASLRTAS
jgi:hypothetical protein